METMIFCDDDILLRQAHTINFLSEKTLNYRCQRQFAMTMTYVYSATTEKAFIRRITPVRDDYKLLELLLVTSSAKVCYDGKLCHFVVTSAIIASVHNDIKLLAIYEHGAMAPTMLALYRPCTLQALLLLYR